jgi:hypothetical protein
LPVFASQATKQILCADQMVVEDPARRGEQVRDEGIAQRVPDAHAFLPPRDDVGRAEDGKLLRHDRLIDTKQILQLLNAFLALHEHFENPDPDRVRERSKESSFERLELVRRDFSHILILLDLRSPQIMGCVERTAIDETGLATPKLGKLAGSDRRSADGRAI